ncbi:MAG: hypothetical protein L0099_10680 [Acidobacteria bacterium]|nr:hypothetical protein [Acidobacteriota bacterium]
MLKELLTIPSLATPIRRIPCPNLPAQRPVLELEVILHLLEIQDAGYRHAILFQDEAIPVVAHPSNQGAKVVPSFRNINAMDHT